MPDINYGEVAVSGALSALGRVITKGTKMLEISEKSSAIIVEITNTFTSAKKDELVN